MSKIFLSSSLLVLIYGCAVVPDHIAAKEIKFSDVQEATSNSVQALLDSGVLKKRDGSKPFVMVGDIENRILPQINTSIILQDIRLRIISSGQAVTMPLAEKKKSAPKKSEKNNILPTFDFLLSGEIVKEKIKGYEKECCSVNLKLTDLKTKLVIWEADEKLIK